MSVFRLHADDILDEMFHLEAIPLNADCRTCAYRRAVQGDPQPLSRPKELFRCASCGVFLECRSCCLLRHQQTPLHSIMVSISRSNTRC